MSGIEGTGEGCVVEREDNAGRYLIGIDLGTTNSALAYVDQHGQAAARSVELFEVPQFVAPGELAPRTLLPSAIYCPSAAEDLFGDVRPPGGVRADLVGELALRQGSRVPGRLIVSSKSWLSHARVDRKAPILPWQGAPGLAKRSPVEAATRLLSYLRDAWDAVMAKRDERARFVKQPVVITVPASFDAVARALTVEAARAAGIEAPLLIEEPQAALYAWIGAHADALAKELPAGSRVLVVDVGGGTTDLTVVEVEEAERGEVVLKRVAVSEHLLLGGDNVDVAIARLVLPRIEAAGGPLEAGDWPMLQLVCREAKEKLLAPHAPEELSVVLPARGRRVVGGARIAKLRREEVESLVLEGFLPRVSLEEANPVRSRAGLQELGLPYAADPAITRHIGAFLKRHAPEGERLLAPSAVLFNGGMVKQKAVRERLLDVIAGWSGSRPRELVSAGFDLAVARGAAYYAMARHGRGIRIRGGMERAYYVGIDAGGDRPAALCVAPRGLEAGERVKVPLALEVKTNTPVAFWLFASTVRNDPPGALVQEPVLEGEGADMQALPPVVTVLKTKRRRAGRARTLPVEIGASLSELGVLELELEAADGSGRRWALEQTVRVASAEEEAAGRIDPELSERIEALVQEAFAEESAGSALAALGGRLEELVGAPREAWSIGVCRALFDVLIEMRAVRERSAQHEARWLNLVGLGIRPGFGTALDSHRIAAFWRVVLQGLLHEEAGACRLEWWIALRRAAGGLGRGQQEQLLGRLQPVLFGKNKRRVRSQELAELWRLAASLERLSAGTKERFGERLLEQIEAKAVALPWGAWALGRLGEREPLYGPLNEVVRAPVARRWIERFMRWVERSGAAERALPRIRFALVQLGRLTGDPARDVDDALRERLRLWLERFGAGADELRPLREVVRTTLPEEQRLLFGDSLPVGLRLV